MYTLSVTDIPRIGKLKKQRRNRSNRDVMWGMGKEKDSMGSNPARPIKLFFF